MEWINITVGTALPILAGLTFKASAPNTVKRTAAIVVTMACAVLVQVIDGASVFTEEMARDAVELFGVQLAAYFGIFRDTPLVELLPNSGIGGGDYDPHAPD